MKHIRTMTVVSASNIQPFTDLMARVQGAIADFLGANKFFSGEIPDPGLSGPISYLFPN